jgi:hypothetical protein
MTALILTLLLASSPSPSPKMSVFVNGGAGREISPGWPLLITVELDHPDDGEAELSFAPRLRFAFNGPEGRVELPAMPIDVPAQIVLRPKTSATSVKWWISAASTLKLAPGKYELVATLDTRREKRGWRGVETCPDELTVRPPSDEEEWQVRRLSTWLDLSRLVPSMGFPDDELDALLKVHPESVGALRIKGSRLEAGGKREEAHALYLRAIKAFEKQNPNPQEPPDSLYRSLRRTER